MPKTLSILIPTIEGREAQLNNLLCNIAKQIEAGNLQKKVQILLFKDKAGQHSIGHKRNWLYQNAKGKWALSIDDDDDIATTALSDIINLLEKNNPDTLSIIGVYIKDGKNPKTFHHSLQYKAYTEVRGFYQRPPGHLNPIRTKIAKKFMFSNVNHGEDSDWSLNISKANAIKTEIEYLTPYYFYNFVSNK